MSMERLHVHGLDYHIMFCIRGRLWKLHANGAHKAKSWKVLRSDVEGNEEHLSLS
jgi:hypothetical protein